jgi:hypothetical protein
VAFISGEMLASLVNVPLKSIDKLERTRKSRILS